MSVHLGSGYGTSLGSHTGHPPHWRCLGNVRALYPGMRWKEALSAIPKFEIEVFKHCSSWIGSFFWHILGGLLGSKSGAVKASGIGMTWPGSRRHPCLYVCGWSYAPGHCESGCSWQRECLRGVTRWDRYRVRGGNVHSWLRTWIGPLVR